MSKVFYELRLKQLYDGVVSMASIFHYHVMTGSGTALELATEFATVVLPKIVTCQTNVITSPLITVLNLFDTTDFVDLIPSGGVGGYAVDTMPPFVAVNFTLRLTDRAIRPGKKRISGIPETVTLKRVVNDATYITALNTLRNQMFTPLQIATVDKYQPIVVKRVFEPATTEHGEYYRMPVDETELVYADVRAALVNLTLTTQNSRKD